MKLSNLRDSTLPGSFFHFSDINIEFGVAVRCVDSSLPVAGRLGENAEKVRF